LLLLLGISCEFYEAEPSDGTGVLDISSYISNIDDEKLNNSNDKNSIDNNSNDNNIISSIWLPASVIILTTAIIAANVLLRKK
jgi:hypothetical protein